jgi:hypothetical protein
MSAKKARYLNTFCPFFRVSHSLQHIIDDALRDSSHTKWQARGRKKKKRQKLIFN